MKRLLVVSALLEVPAGLAFLLTPSVAAQLFFGSTLDSLAETNLGRGMGSALLGLGLAFWLGRNDGRAPAARGLAVAMLLYSTGATLLLVTSAIGSHVSAPALWPAAVVHAAMAVWCGWSLRTGPGGSGAARDGVPRVDTV